MLLPFGFGESSRWRSSISAYKIGDEVIRDPHTYDFPTAQDARDGAIHAVHELIVANPDDIEIEQREIEIADATGHAVTVVSLREVAPWRG